MNFISKRYLQHIFDIYFDSNSIQHNNKNSQIKTQQEFPIYVPTLAQRGPNKQSSWAPWDQRDHWSYKEEMQRDK